MAFSASATPFDDTQPGGHILRLGIDLGTGHMTIDDQLVRGDHACDPQPLCLKGTYRGASIEQIAILEANGNVIYGRADVLRAVREHPELRDKVMERFKLAMHPESAHLNEVQHVKEVLCAEEDPGALQDFFADLFRTLFRDVRTLYKSPGFNTGRNADYWNTIPLELQISVPAMWDDDARGTIRNAAKTAGCLRAELREEPLCVATTNVLELYKKGRIQAGQRLLLIDCGQGTLDIALVKLVREPSAGQLVELECVGVCSGTGAGAHMVNTAAEEWLLSEDCEAFHQVDFEEACRRLGLSERQFLQAFCEEIDSIKERIDTDLRDILPAVVRSIHRNAGPGSLYQMEVSIPRTLLMTWYATWTNEAKSLLEQHLRTNRRERIDGALLTGGGANSGEFRSQMHAVLEKSNGNITILDPTLYMSPCSSGALMQHFFQESTLPPDAIFYIAQTEAYEAAVHGPEACNAGLIHVSEYDDNVRIVHKRLSRIMESSEESGFKSAGFIAQSFYVDAGTLPRIHVNLFWSYKPRKEHTALEDAHRNRRPGIRSYPLVFVDSEDFGDLGFTTVRDKGKPHFLVHGFLRMEGTSDSLVLSMYLMKHDYKFPERYLEATPKNSTSQIDEQPPFNREQILKIHTEEVWNKDCSHFVSPSTGVARPKAKKRVAPVQVVGSRKSARLSERAAINTGDSETCAVT
jgi:hypothetical protein